MAGLLESRIETMTREPSSAEEAASSDPTVESFTDPETLRERDDVRFVEAERTFEREQFEGLRKRYRAIAGVAMVGVTTDDGEVLLWGEENVSPPGGSVPADEDWVATACDMVASVVGQQVEIDDVELVEWTRFRLADDDAASIVDDETASFPAPVVHFSASLVDPDPAFLDAPAVPEDFEHELFEDDDPPTLDWYDGMPEDVHPNHEDHVALYLD